MAQCKGFVAGLTEVSYFGVKPHARRRGDLPVWSNAGDLWRGRLTYSSVKPHATRDGDFLFGAMQEICVWEDTRS